MATQFSCTEPATIYQKVNECCILVRLIDECEDIGDSMDKINFNFQNLEAHTCNLELSANQLWNPAWSIMSANSAKWMSVLATVQDLSACWQSAATTVEDLSAAWLDPISVIYPNPVPPGTNTNVGTINSWVQSNFPVSGEPDVDGCNIVNYPEGQKLWVFTPEYTTAIQQLSETCQSPCNFVRAKVSVWISTINYGAGAYSSAATWLEPGQKVKAGSGHWQGRATLHEGECRSTVVTIEGNYTDKHLDMFDGLEFCVVGGVWSYIGSIPGY